MVHTAPWQKQGRNTKQNGKNSKEIVDHYSHTLAQKQPKEMSDTLQVLVEKEDAWNNVEEKREEGEVFTLRVIIHYRKAEAHSVTLSQ